MKKIFLLATLVASFSLLATTATWADYNWHRDDRGWHHDDHGYWDDHHAYHRYEYYHGRPGYWDHRGGVRVFLYFS